MKDANGNTIGTLGFTTNGDAPMLTSKLPDSLPITPEAQGNHRDYFIFYYWLAELDDERCHRDRKVQHRGLELGL
jgi:hypothetical protein